MNAINDSLNPNEVLDNKVKEILPMLNGLNTKQIEFVCSAIIQAVSYLPVSVPSHQQ